MTWVKLDDGTIHNRGDVHLEGYPVREIGMWDDDHPYALYRCFGAAGGLFYVGITCKSVRTRLDEHKRRHWFAGVVRVEITYGYTRAEAFRCELAAIQGEQPLFNGTGVNYGWPRKGGLSGWQFLEVSA